MTIVEYLIQKQIPHKLTSEGEWIEISCPFVEHKKPRCYINSKSGGFHCFYCGNSGHWQFLAERLKLPKDIELTLSTPEEYFDPPPLDISIVEEQEKNLWETPSLIEYLHRERGYSDETIKKFRLGWDGRNLTIPIADANGDIVNIKFRRDPTLPNARKKMWQLTGRGNKRLFNERVLKNKQERLILVEGEWDCMLLHQFGYVAVTSTGGAMSFDEKWIESFGKCEKIYICFDNDRNNTGQQAMIKTAKLFYEKRGIKTFLISLPQLTSMEEKLDIVDFFVKRKKEKSDFTQLLLSAQKYQGEYMAGIYNFISKEELFEMEFAPDQWIVKHFIPKEGITCIAGLPGTMKSYITNYIATCIVTGTSLFDKFETSTCPILFIDKENRLSRIKQRLSFLGMPKATENEIYFLKGDFLIEKPDAVSVVENFVIAHNIKLIIMDTLVRMHSKTENDASEMNKVFHILFRLVQTGASILFIHHFNKRGSGLGQTTDVRELLRGSGDILAQLDTYFAISHVEGNFYKIEFGKSRDETLLKPFLIEADFGSDSTHFSYIKEIIDEERLATIIVEDEILRLLFNGTMTRPFLINNLKEKVSVTAIDRAIKRLKQLGKITTFTNGKREHMYSFVKEDKITNSDL